MRDLATSSSRGPAAADYLNRALLPFFLLLIVLTVPFWVVGAVTGLQLLPGLPVAALAAYCPAAAAAILVHRRFGVAGVIALLRRAVDLRPTLWLASTLLLMPLVMAMSYGVQRLGGQPVPSPQITLGPAAALVVVTLVAAVGEELGWSGYAIDPMQARWGDWALLPVSRPARPPDLGRQQRRRPLPLWLPAEGPARLVRGCGSSPIVWVRRRRVCPAR